MPSDRRFHPLTVLFALGGELRNFLAPILFATFTARSRGGDMQNWLLIFMIPSLAIAVARYWVSTYRYAETELVVRTGLFFKNERHIPYARIQSVDAKQNVFHRFFKVVEVKVQTGTGGEAEATLSVLPLEALEEMRERVYAGKRAAQGDLLGAVPGAEAAVAGTEATAPVALPPPPEIILHLPIGETALSGLLDNRGWVVIGAASGVFWETGMMDRFQSLPQTSWTFIAAVAAGLFVVSPILSVVWAVVRLHGFTLSRRGAELFTEYGAMTRVTATIPLRRVQAVKIIRGPGYLLTNRAAIRVDTAGGGANGGGAERDWIAPIIRNADVPTFVKGLLPDVADVALDAIEWQPAHDNAATRRMRRAVYRAIVLGALSTVWLEGHWALALTAGVGAWGVVAARQYVRHLGWARSNDAVYFRSGWLWKAVTIVPIPKVQSVSLHESVLDRRWQMASVAVDTAGAGGHQVDVPYLPRDTAEDLRVALVSQAAATTYRW
jgi:putative membrane protein